MTEVNFFAVPVSHHESRFQNDVLQVRNAMHTAGYSNSNMVVIPGAKKNQVTDAVHQIAQKCKEEDVFVFYTSGHGQDPAKSQNNELGIMYSDGILSASTLTKSIKAVKTNKKILMIHCCFAGAFLPGGTGGTGSNSSEHTSNTELICRNLQKASGSVCIMAGPPREVTYGNHFPRAVVEAFSRNGQLDWASLSSHINEYVDKHLNAAGNTSQYVYLDARGAEVFPVKPAHPAAQVRVPHGASVFIKTIDGYYLAKNPLGTFCAAASKNLADRAIFRITYDRNSDTEVQNAYDRTWIRIFYNEPHTYLGPNRYLYAATTGSAKYDESRRSNSKQFWKLNYEGSIDLFYDTEVSFLDLYVDSYLCVNASAPAAHSRVWQVPGSPLFGVPFSGYGNAGEKVWVEGKYQRHLLSNFKHKFVVEHAD